MVDLEGLVASKIRGLRDQICTTYDPKVDCVRQRDLWWKAHSPPCGTGEGQNVNPEALNPKPENISPQPSIINPSPRPQTPHPEPPTVCLAHECVSHVNISVTSLHVFRMSRRLS